MTEMIWTISLINSQQNNNHSIALSADIITHSNGCSHCHPTWYRWCGWTGFTVSVWTSIINQPCMGLAVNSYLLPTSKSCDTKTGTKIKNLDRQALGIVP